MIEIFSKDNKLVKHVTKLCDDRKYRYKTRQFIIEGLRLVREAYICNADMEYAFVTRDFYEKNSGFVDNISACLKECYIINDTLAKKISDTQNPQGIFCICNMNDNNLYTSDINSDGKYVILNSLQDPGNVGTIIRSADAFCVSAVIVSEDCADIYSPKVIRSTMGSCFRVKSIICKKENICDTIRALKNKNIKVYATNLDKNSKDIREVTLGKGSCIVTGNEGNGLPQDVIDVCDGSVIIPMNDKTESLNASIATAICIWEMFRQD